MYNREWGEGVWGRSNLLQKSPNVFLNKSLDPLPPPRITNSWIRPCLTLLSDNLKVHLAPKYFFQSNKSLHLFEMHCTFLPRFNPNLDFLQAVKVTKSGHYLLHNRASKGYGSIPGWMSQTDLHLIKSL